MAFISYISYDEYKELGGIVSEDDFSTLERKAQRYLDHFTFNRIQEFEPQDIPEQVKEVLTEYINKLNTYTTARLDEGSLISKYSNGVETIDYRYVNETEVRRNLGKVAREWLPDYLLNRSVKFNVREYLQSKNNNS